MEQFPQQKNRATRIYTCTPVAFSTEARFFTRDTGLIHTQLKAMGVESRCILALPHTETDMPDPEGRIIRATLADMQSPQWWRKLDIDGVYLYSWGAPRYLMVARAIHKAGIRLAIHMDTGDRITYWHHELPLGKRLYKAARELAVECLRVRHLNYADVVTTSRAAQRGMRNTPFYRRSSFTFHEMPCPVAPYFSYDGTPKQARIISVGRWDDEHQKRTRHLMSALEQLTNMHTGVEADICGTITDELKTWHANLPEQCRNRIHLLGFVTSENLPALYNRAQIVFCPSRFESSCIAVGEALCCGCSAVSSNRPYEMSTVMDYAFEPGCGRVAEQDTAESMAQALLDELESWQTGNRNPEAIARRWQPSFHPEPILRGIFNLP